MELLTWSEEYSVGVKALDDQHKKIIRLIHELSNQPDLAVNSEIVSDILGDMRSYATEHLKFEEKMLQDNNYPDYETHKATHTEYQEKVVELIFQVMAGDREAPQALLDYLNEWWTNHILTEDMKYRPFFEEKGIT